MNDAERFLSALARGLQEEERLILCGFVGDPNTVGPTAWKPRPWRPGKPIVFSPKANAYTTVGAFGRAGDGSFRRRTETFSAGLALMVDDVGTKVSRETVEGLRPSAIVETSEGNEQWWYFLEPAERDAAAFDGVIRAFISGKLLGADPGMAGINRVGRLPGFTNGKAQHRNFRTRLVELNDSRFSIPQLLEAFGLKINGRRRLVRERLATEEARERNAAFLDAFRFLREREMMKKDGPDLSGWIEMSCPWVDEHTNQADTGAALREPAEENAWFGAFRCHHGHCADRGWRELTEWISELAAEELEHANEND